MKDPNPIRRKAMANLRHALVGDSRARAAQVKRLVELAVALGRDLAMTDLATVQRRADHHD